MLERLSHQPFGALSTATTGLCVVAA